MYARLNPNYWGWKDDDGVRGAFVVSEVYRYQGMLAGITPAGLPFARPVVEFDALSMDALTWHPLYKLLPEIPWENDDVPEQIVRLPYQRGADHGGVHGPVGEQLLRGGGNPDLRGAGDNGDPAGEGA